MNDRFVFTVHYDEALMRAVARRYIWLGHSYSNPVNTPLAFVIFVGVQTGINTGVRFLQLSLDISFLVVLLVVVLIACGLFWLHWRSVYAGLRPMIGQEVVFHLGDQGLSLGAKGRVTRFSWYDFEGIRRAERFWLLIRAPGAFVTLPLAGLPAGILDFLESKSALARDGKLLSDTPA